ncbi:MAG: site-specific integrase, partial [Verrucomicrobiota bacterium]|nr:site-specific integrase [Verrucomicrobiota bacterium]
MNTLGIVLSRPAHDGAGSLAPLPRKSNLRNRNSLIRQAAFFRAPSCQVSATLLSLAPQIDSFILYLATERGLSDAYQLSVRRTLETLADWAQQRDLPDWQDLGIDHLREFLSQQKSRGLEASSLRIAVVHLKIFFRFLVSRNLLGEDPAEPLLSPRTGSSLPGTLQVS